MSGRTRVIVGPFRRTVNGVVGFTQVTLGVGIAPEAVIAERLAICNACPNLINGRCALCTCTMTIKTQIASQRCVDDPPRWGAVQVTVGNTS